MRQYRADNRDRMAGYTRKWKYGISQDDYDRLFAEQGGVCAICRKPETAKDRLGRTRTNLSVDHDHRTGAIRGLLCHHCNAALGHVDDDLELLRSLVAYLEASNARSE